jgi:peptidoglycan hydrolase-like protein with peptidoglycan-binding domain
VPGIDIKSGKDLTKEVRGVLPAGARLHDYEIISVLGQGVFGVTYLARDTTLDCKVAIKEYLPLSLALHDGGMNVVPRSAELSEPFVWGRERFLGEARTLAKLGHVPAIVRVDDLFEANGTAYMVMELVQGETLRRRLLRDNRLSPSTIDRILSSLLEGLEAIHAAGLLHHDIKPANIIVDPRGNPTLIDFGGARAAMAGRMAATAAASTLDYAAPEQFASARKGPWTDIYGLSATLYHAVTGGPPPGVFDRMLGDSCQPLAQLMPAGFTPGLLIGLDAGLKMAPGERPQSIADWRAILPPSGPLDEQASFVMRGPSFLSPLARARHGMGLWIGVPAALMMAAVVADGALRLAAPSIETADAAHRSVAAALQPQPSRDAVASRQPVAAHTAIEAAALRIGGTEAPAADPKAAEDKLAAEAARREAEAREAYHKQQAAEIESAREAAERQGHTAVEEALRREAAVDLHRAEGPAAAAATESGPKTEAALDLSEGDRKRVQAALTALGHDVPTTGYFGPISRKMIAAWQKAQGLPETGFLDASQLTALYAMERTKLEAPRAEAALNLSDQDRRKVQAALTALGHDVPRTGHFGPITRRMITTWQRAQGLPPTGYLTDTQLTALQQQGAAGTTR